MSIPTAHLNHVPPARELAGRARVTWERVLLVLVFRLVGFGLFQALIAAVFALGGEAEPWAASVAWWPLSAIVVGAATLVLLNQVARREGMRYVDLIAARRDTVGRDLLWLLVVMLIAGPIAYLPMQGLSQALYGDPQAASALMFRPLPGWLAAAQLLLFPLATALSELPAYYGYVMPRLEGLSSRSETGFLRRNPVSIAMLLPALFLAAQHATLPLIFDWRFIVWRIAMFLPFALLLAFALHRRPSLLPYLMVGHFLIDLSTAWFVFAAR